MGKNCIISEVSRTFRGVASSDLVAYGVVTQTINATYQTNNATFYVQVVTMSVGF